MTHEELDAMCHDEEETERLYKKFLDVTGFPEELIESHCLVCSMTTAFSDEKQYMKKPMLCVIGNGGYSTFPVLFCED